MRCALASVLPGCDEKSRSLRGCSACVEERGAPPLAGTTNHAIVPLQISSNRNFAALAPEISSGRQTSLTTSSALVRASSTLGLHTRRLPAGRWKGWSMATHLIGQRAWGVGMPWRDGPLWRRKPNAGLSDLPHRRAGGGRSRRGELEDRTSSGAHRFLTRQAARTADFDYIEKASITGREVTCHCVG